MQRDRIELTWAELEAMGEVSEFRLDALVFAHRIRPVCITSYASSCSADSWKGFPPLPRHGHP
jgi:hypothetical protein